MFEPLPAKFDFVESEKDVLAFWERHGVFQKSLDQRAGAERFVFYEGPPTANGLPHPGHCLTRAMKDLFPRYQTMCGKLVERKAGWDTHGLPVEVEVCKELGIHTKEEIEAYGVEKFVRLCIESVFRYTRQWEEMTKRLGFWVNLDEAYVTFHQSYVESVWWGLKTLFERGLLYQGHKVVWWWAQGGTALSAGEVGEGYRTVDDPSVFVKFPLVDQEGEQATGEEVAERRANEVTHAGQAATRTSLLVWTTTPWTLLDNHFAAVNPDIQYSFVHDPVTDEYFYVAETLVETIAGKVKHELVPLFTCSGRALVGARYIPPFRDVHYDNTFGTDDTFGSVRIKLTDGNTEYVGWRVLAADFVTVDSGTGLVHQAPAYGEVDYDLLESERTRFDNRDVPLLCCVKLDGTFTSRVPEEYRGRWIKDCDKDIIRDLRNNRMTPWGTSLLFHQETYRHDYPFCPRAEDDPLIQYARKSWFVRTSEYKDEFLKNNAGINWLPEHIKEGRFGDFLRNNVDWALSRERFWGTPLPIWVCEKCGKMEAIGSLDELKAKPGATDGGMWERKKAEDPALPEHLQVHKPYIDEWTFDAPCCAGARMRRVPEVIDCWWDAGSMPFAQWGFPHRAGSVEKFANAFPANFISEALDQTRGWFYGLLAISSLLFGNDEVAEQLRREFPHPYKTCIVLGLMMGEDGLKMSKRKKNYKEPTWIFDHHGADALRWFLFSGQTPWTSVRFQEANIRDAHREFLVRLYNVFSFFNIYANIDGFEARDEGTEGRKDGGNDEESVACATGYRPVSERGELDRWIISELHRTTRDVRASLDRFENYPATQKLNDLVDALSNWYVRRSRERFWKSEKDQDKWDAYNTLYDVLVALSKLIAPFTPFFAETMYQNLCKESDGATKRQSDEGGRPVACSAGAPDSVHLCSYPVVDESLIDEDLAGEMALVRQIVSLGRAARTAAKLKVRQPLALAEVVLAKPEFAGWLGNHRELVAEELNIKQIELACDADQYVTYHVKPNFKAIGPKFGGLAKQIAPALAQMDPAAARAALDAGGISLKVGAQDVRLTDEDVEVRLEAKPGWSAAQGRGGVVVVKTDLTPELIEEGLIRELIHHVQQQRREHDLAYEARITLHIEAPDEFAEIVRRHAGVLERECLAPKIEYSLPAGAAPLEAKVEGHAIRIVIATQ
ncbi:MAG: isoleucine--tRNA ligase [Phycisphaerae bacterium]|nr:isoleucine--tRNA ligase [Phycisphaerae bacterium]